MRTLKDVISYETAPPVQWEPIVGDKPSEGKQLEDSTIHTAVADVLAASGAMAITGIIADEARLEVTVAEKIPAAREINHLTLSGVFEQAARKNVDDAGANVRVTSDVDAIAPASQDAVVMNMILGCVSTPEDHNNMNKLVQLAESYLRENGELVIVRPNPEAGTCTTYACLTPANDLRAGENYQFTVKGLEEFGAMNNLYTPDAFLGDLLGKSGFTMGPTVGLTDAFAKANTPEAKPAFLMNVCKLTKKAPTFG